MNKQLQEFARNYIKEGLAKLTDFNHNIFKRMYSHENLDVDINDLVDAMPEDRLDWAMRQVQASVDKMNVETANE